MCNGMMSGALVLLGFTSCDENSTGTGRCEYGTPYAKYEIKGKVMGEDRQVVSDARILVKNMAPQTDNLKKAVAKDSSLAKKAASDLEFSKYFTNADFMNIIK